MDQVAGASEKETIIIADTHQKPMKIAFQGQPGAYSHMACQQACPELEPVPAETFDEAFTAVSEGRTERAMIAIDNSVAGRVADVHHLMPRSGLYIVGEHFQRVNHHLLALPGTRIDQLKIVHSHVHALNQCRKLLRDLPVSARVHADTAGAAGSCPSIQRNFLQSMSSGRLDRPGSGLRYRGPDNRFHGISGKANLHLPGRR